jgi:hypothetical protein
METIIDTHHLSKKTISGYGWDDFLKNYNLHTINEHGKFDHVIPRSVSNSAQLWQHVQDLEAKKESLEDKVVAPEPENKRVTLKKGIKKAAKKTVKK